MEIPRIPPVTPEEGEIVPMDAQTPAISLQQGWWLPIDRGGPGKWLKRAAVIPFALTFWPGLRRHAIQAGAHVGVWPVRLRHYFASVTCFEPAPQNYACLLRNIHQDSQIQCMHGVVGDRVGHTRVSIQPRSTGGHHVAVRQDRPTVSVAMYTIDGLTRTDVDAIFLDIEGYELLAVQGAETTITQCHPLLVLEDNGCSRRYGVARGALAAYLSQRWGYEPVATYGEDTIFVSPRMARKYGFAVETTSGMPYLPQPLAILQPS